jgi:hypothetical protein
MNIVITRYDRNKQILLKYITSNEYILEDIESILLNINNGRQR